MTKTLIENPKLEIQSANDGVWLHFRTADGKHASLNLPTLYKHDGGIIDKAVHLWCLEYAHANPPNADLSHADTTLKQKETSNGK